VINVIREEGLMENVRTVSRMLAEACPIGPVTGIQGSGFLIGMRCGENAAQVKNQLLARNILVGNSADPEVLRLMPPLILERKHMQLLIDSLSDIPVA
jgi:acetylornithine aminotransferase